MAAKKNNPFTASQFTATVYDGTYGEERSKRAGFDSRAQKAKTANHLIKFLLADCPFYMFHDWFYKELYLHFGHIAHYDRYGFYNEWFDSAKDRVEFVSRLVNTNSVAAFGDPRFTYCDVVHALREYILEDGIPEQLKVKADTARLQSTIDAATRLLATLTPEQRKAVLDKAEG